MKILRGSGTWIVVAAVAAVGVIAGVDALRSSDEETSASATTETRASTSQPSATTTAAEGSGSQPAPALPRAYIRGWIVYAADKGINEGSGIWAIDPTHPGGGRPRRIRLSDQSGEPVAWSRDGSKLLIFRRFDVDDVEGRTSATFSLLRADGVEKSVLQTKDAWIASASLSPDGLQVVYSTNPPLGGLRPGFGIYLADVNGGGLRLLQALHRRWYPSKKQLYATLLLVPTFAPDGSRIAYVDGMGDWGNSIRVMDADGENVRVLIDWRRGGLQEAAMDNHVIRLAWSPDGSRLAFETVDDGIWVVGSDGSGLRLLIRHGHNPTWSPDGSRLAYATWNESGRCCQVQLRIADADGSHVQTLAHVDTGPEGGFAGGPAWNPVDPAGN